MPFRVLDASAIEGIRGLAGDSSSLYSCIQIYKALTPPAPPPAYRGATEGPGPPSYVGSSEERPCPDLGLCAPPSAPAGAGAAVEGWAPPPSRRLHLPSEAQAQEPPPRGSADGLPHPCAARGAADCLPHALPCPPVSHCRAPVPVLPAHGGRGGGLRRGGGRGEGGGCSAGPPALPGVSQGRWRRRRRSKNFVALIVYWCAMSCQPQPLEGEKGGGGFGKKPWYCEGGGGGLLLGSTAILIHPCLK